MQLSTTLIFLLFSVILFTKVQAQVIIKEKVEINPQKTILTKTPAGNHTIRVDIQWSPSSLPGWILFYDLQCDQQDYYSPSTTTGTNSFSLTSQGYENYPIQFRFGSLDPNQPIVSGSYQIYYDEIFIRSATFTANKASYTNFAYYNTYYQSPVLTDYTFLISGNEICFGLYKNVQIETSRNCNTTAEINTEQDSITLTIETGKEFVSFYKNSQKKDTVTFMYHELGSVYLRQDSTYTGTAPINVNIKSDWTGIIKYQQLVINPQEQFQIRVPDQPIIVFSGGVGGLKIETYNSSICPPYISENLRYTALIKKGSSRGLLYDYDTGIGGDTLTNLTPQEDGEKYLDFITEGEILNEEDTVLIKIFANDENIDTTEAVIIIYPNDLVVQIIPSVISQGDTARVVLKKRGVNGLEDFAVDKLFNVEIVQGLDYGLILDSLSNDTLTIFSNIPQGFKIIAKDSTGIDSTKIRIKVTTEESFFPSAKMLTVDKYKLYIKESDKKAKEEAEDEKDKTIIPNFIIPGTLLLEGYGDVFVKKDGCDEGAPICNFDFQSPIEFKEEVTEVTGSYTFIKEGYYPKQLNIISGGRTYLLEDGSFKVIPINASNNDPIYGVPLSGSFYSPYEIETCYNQTLNNGKGAYQFKYKALGSTDNYIYKPIIIQVADYSNNLYAMKSVNDLATIPIDSTCRALIDFEYGRYRKSYYDDDHFFNKLNIIYEIVEAYWEHEKYHKRSAITFLNEKYDKEKIKVTDPNGSVSIKTLKQHLQTTVKCSQNIKNYNDAKRLAEKYFEDAFREYAKYFINNWYGKKVKIFFNDEWMTYIREELYAHWSDSVQKKITKYQFILASRQGFNPEECSYNFEKLWEPFKKYRNNR